MCPGNAQFDSRVEELELAALKAEDKLLLAERKLAARGLPAAAAAEGRDEEGNEESALLAAGIQERDVHLAEMTAVRAHATLSLSAALHALPMPLLADLARGGAAAGAGGEQAGRG